MPKTGFKSLPFAGSEAEAEMEGPSGEIINLLNTAGAGIGNGYSRFSWSTVGRVVHDLEIRVLILSCNGTIGTVPLFRWYLEIGHGQVKHREPYLTDGAGNGAATIGYTLPARGLVHRVSARDLDLYFKLDGQTAGVPPAGLRAQLQVSVQPVKDAFVPVTPSEHAVVVAGATIANPIPAAAREWRARDGDGQPFAGGVPAVQWLGICGALGGVVPASAMADWSPIPTFANRYLAGLTIVMGFR